MMNNGQLNIASMLTVMPSATLESVVPVAVTMDGVQQVGGDFAGLLSGLQLLTQETPQTDSGQIKPSLVRDNMKQLDPDTRTEGPVVDLLALLQASPRISPALELAATKSELPETTEAGSDAEPLRHELPDVTSQMAMSAYFQSGRMPDVNKPTPFPVDGQQNVAIVEQQSVAISAHPVAQNVEPFGPELMPAAVQKAITTEVEKPTAAFAMEPPHQQQSETVGTTAVDPLLTETVVIPVALTAAPPAPIAAQAETVATATDVNKPTALPVDRLQNTPAAGELPVVIAAPAVQTHTDHVVADATQDASTPATEQKTVVVPSKQPAVEHAAAQKPRPSEPVGAIAVDRQPALAATTVPVSPVVAAIPPAVPASHVVQAESTALRSNEPARTAEVNKPTALHVDRLQNIPAVEEPPVVTAAPAVQIHTDHVVAEATQEASTPATEQKTVVVPSEQPAVEHAAAQKPQPSEPVGAIAVDRQPALAATTVPVSPVVAATPSAVPASRVVQAEPTALRSNEPARTAEVNKPTALHVERLQNTPAVGESPAIVASVVTHQVKQAVANSAQVVTPRSSAVQQVEPSVEVPEMVQNQQQAEAVRSAPVERSSITTAVAEPAAFPSQSEAGEALGVKTAELSGMPKEKPAVVSAAISNERPPVQSLTAMPAQLPASELDILLSQPQPITARISVPPAAVDNRVVSLVQESRGGRQRLAPEQQLEKGRSGSEQANVKEMTLSLPSAVSSDESMMDSDSSNSGDSSQGQSGGGDDNPLLAQNMRAQAGSEQQKLSVVTAKPASSEPAHQEIPEQIVHQVRDRLVQHEVKPGNQQITLTLSPDNLGELKMNLNLQGQKLSVEIITENRAVRDAIMQHADTLKDSLARQNITMESFDVTTGGKGSNSQGQNQNAWRELNKQQQQQQLWASPRSYHTAQADLPSGPAAYPKQHGHSMLDIHY